MCHKVFGDKERSSQNVIVIRVPYIHIDTMMLTTKQLFRSVARGRNGTRSFSAGADTLFSTHTTKGADHNENIIWSDALITKEERQKFLQAGHGGATLWITGLSGSGKSTIGAALEKELLEMGVQSYRLDGDNVRFGLNKDLGFTAEDREENIRRVAETAALFNDAGIVTITAFISPYKVSRELAREIHESRGLKFIEVHAHVPLEVAEARDPKGLYKKARKGEIKNFTGIDDPFEEPEDPEVKLHTHEMSVPACVGALISELKFRKVVTGKMKIMGDQQQ